jgi:hypothetical protein
MSLPKAVQKHYMAKKGEILKLKERETERRRQASMSETEKP